MGESRAPRGRGTLPWLGCEGPVAMCEGSRGPMAVPAPVEPILKKKKITLRFSRRLKFCGTASERR